MDVYARTASDLFLVGVHHNNEIVYHWCFRGGLSYATSFTPEDVGHFLSSKVLRKVDQLPAGYSVKAHLQPKMALV